MLRGCLIPVATPHSDQVELALMLALGWLVAGAYNQLLIYRYVPGLDLGANRLAAIGNALTLICMIVLTWGKPAVVLFPHQFSPLVILLLILALALAGLGNCFVVQLWQATNRLSLWLGPGTLAAMTIAVPLAFNGNNRWGWLLAMVIVAGIQLTYFRQLPRLLIMVAASRSTLYNMLVGAELAALFSSLLLGMISCYQQFAQGILSRLSICWGSAGVFLRIGAMVLAACQRYHNDFRYGHAIGHTNSYVTVGALCWVGLLFGLILAV